MPVASTKLLGSNSPTALCSLSTYIQVNTSQYALTVGDALNYYFPQNRNVKVMDCYVWLGEVFRQKDEWTFVTMAHGVQYVTIYGTTMMLELFADNLDILLNVSLDKHYSV